MVAKILSSSASFNGVNYNTNKIDENKGELMRVENFGPLQGLVNLRPEDYSNYLKLISAQNTRVKLPQFHATISCKGKEYDKQQLTDIAAKWLVEMGYAKNPYLIVFHKDTGNNHVHVVSTRIDKEGKKISSAFEKIRAVQNINKVMGFDEILNVKQEVEKALSYQFSTRAQFMMILESGGYILSQNDGNIGIIKFGKKLIDLDSKAIDAKVSSYSKDVNREAQLSAIFKKYKLSHSTELFPKTISKAGGIKESSGVYSSDFCEFLKKKFGVELVFHGKDGKTPYGYSIIDHAKKNVFKGGDVFPLKELLGFSGIHKVDGIENMPNCIESRVLNPANILSTEQINYYTTILKAALYNYPTLKQGLKAQGLEITQRVGVLFLNDILAGVEIPVNDVLNSKDYLYLNRNVSGMKNYTSEKTKDEIISANTEKAFSLKGILLNFGVANYQFKREAKPSFFIEIKKNGGTTKTIWGKDLERALEASGFNKGDLIQINYRGSQSVKVNIPIKNAEGIIIDYEDKMVERNDWSITIPDVRGEHNPPSRLNSNFENQVHSNDTNDCMNSVIDINIADDVDDEQIHGRNRKRQGKARTNTR